MSGKIILITGGSSGLGLEACRQLHGAGHNVLFVGRDGARCKEAKKIIEEAGKGGVVDFFVADLLSQKQIRKLSDEIHSRVSRIDVLINNAGGVFSRFEKSEDGIEKTFALNHLGYFLLTSLLLDLLPSGGRVINVSSQSHIPGKIDFESLTQNKNYNILKAYNQSKLANVLFTYELARQLAEKNITVNALHPGRVRTRIGNKNQPWYLSLGWSILVAVSSISPAHSIRTFLYLTESDQVKNTTGRYFAFSKEIKSSALSYDETLAKKLWLVSSEMTGRSSSKERIPS